MDFNKHAFILEVVEALTRHHGWCGKTQVNKSLYLLEDLARLQVPFQFVLYKHGPYSFEIESSTEEMKSYDAIQIQPLGGYGVSIAASENADYVRGKFKITDSDKVVIERLCQWTAPKGVADLEKIATAVWVRKNDGLTEPSAIAEKVHELKPHISVGEALKADEQAVGWATREMAS
jgi:uncharacterized protein YwgA